MPRDWMIKDQPRTKYTEKLLLPEGATANAMVSAMSVPCRDAFR